MFPKSQFQCEISHICTSQVLLCFLYFSSLSALRSDLVAFAAVHNGNIPLLLFIVSKIALWPLLGTEGEGTKFTGRM